jgi:hypothetical protein
LTLFGAVAALILVSVLGLVLLPTVRALGRRPGRPDGAVGADLGRTAPDTRPAFEAELLRQHS